MGYIVTLLYVNIMYFCHIYPGMLSAPFPLLLIAFLFPYRLLSTSLSFFFNDPICFIRVAYRIMDKGLFTELLTTYQWLHHCRKCLSLHHQL